VLAPILNPMSYLIDATKLSFAHICCDSNRFMPLYYQSDTNHLYATIPEHEIAGLRGVPHQLEQKIKYFDCTKHPHLETYRQDDDVIRPWIAVIQFQDLPRLWPHFEAPDAMTDDLSGLLDTLQNLPAQYAVSRAHVHEYRFRLEQIKARTPVVVPARSAKVLYGLAPYRV
jgi:hypothetical protein